MKRKGMVHLAVCIGACTMLFMSECAQQSRNAKEKQSDEKCFVEDSVHICAGEKPATFCYFLTADSTLDYVVVSSTVEGAVVNCTLDVSSEIYANPVDRICELRDYNDDGCLDFCVYSNFGVNSNAQYWIRKSNGIYKSLGCLPELQIDSTTKRLVSYVRGGYAGGEYERREYFFENDTLKESFVQSQKFKSASGDTMAFVLTEFFYDSGAIDTQTTHLKVYRSIGDSVIFDTIREY